MDPDACLLTGVALQGPSQSPPTPKAAREMSHVTPTPTPKRTGWKVCPEPKHETDEMFLWCKRKSMEEWDHWGTSSLSQHTGRKGEGKEG